MHGGHRLLLFVALVAAWFASTAVAGEADSAASMEARLNNLEGQVARVNELEAELAAVRQQLQGSLATPSHDGCDACCGEPPCCEPCCCLPCCQIGYYGGAEFVWAQPSIHLLGLEYDYQASPRVWLGYNGCGLGVRGHWWRFDGDGDPATAVELFDDGGGNITETQSLINETLELDLADLEVTKRFSACGSTIVVAAGGRYVRYERETTTQSVIFLNGVFNGTSLRNDTERLEGFGPTLAAEVVTPITCWWSLYAGFRATIAFGDQDVEQFTLLSTGDVFADAFSRNDRVQVVEIDLALQYTVGCWFARAGWQAQHWDEPTIFSLGVQGFAVAVGANY